jgi:hypothetical protein
MKWGRGGGGGAIDFSLNLFYLPWYQVCLFTRKLFPEQSFSNVMVFLTDGILCPGIGTV